jgi:hypothetical protein
MEDEMMLRGEMALFVGAFLAGTVAAQAATSPQTPSAPAVAAQTEPAASLLPSGTAINAELNSSVDSKKAKVGDKVEAHTTEAVAIAGKTLVPRGAKLEGHIIEATARSKGDNGSTLAIQFDKAIARKGEELPLNVLIMAVAPPQSPQYAAGASGPGSDPMSDRGAAAAGGSPMGASRPQSTAGGTAGYPSSGSAGSTVEANGSSQLSADSRGVYGLKDLKLMEHKSDAGQTTVIISEGKNVRLDGGTRLLLVAQGAGAGSSAATEPSN